jgi:hypothetical protein
MVLLLHVASLYMGRRSQYFNQTGLLKTALIVNQKEFLVLVGAQ